MQQQFLQRQVVRRLVNFNAGSKSRMCPIRRLLSLPPDEPTLSRLSTSLVIAGTSRVSRVAATRRLCLCAEITSEQFSFAPLSRHSSLSTRSSILRSLS